MCCFCEYASSSSSSSGGDRCRRHRRSRRVSSWRFVGTRRRAVDRTLRFPASVWSKCRTATVVPSERVSHRPTYHILRTPPPLPDPVENPSCSSDTTYISCGRRAGERCLRRRERKFSVLFFFFCMFWFRSYLNMCWVALARVHVPLEFFPRFSFGFDHDCLPPPTLCRPALTTAVLWRPVLSKGVRCRQVPVVPDADEAVRHVRPDGQHWAGP